MYYYICTLTKSSTFMVGYDVGVTNIVKIHAVMNKPLRGPI